MSYYRYSVSSLYLLYLPSQILYDLYTGMLFLVFQDKLEKRLREEMAEMTRTIMMLETEMRQGKEEGTEARQVIYITQTVVSQCNNGITV